jgi:hypothetical protein
VTILTCSIVLLNKYANRHTADYPSIYEIAMMRSLSNIVGITAAIIVGMCMLTECDSLGSLYFVSVRLVSYRLRIQVG